MLEKDTLIFKCRTLGVGKWKGVNGEMDNLIWLDTNIKTPTRSEGVLNSGSERNSF